MKFRPPFLLFLGWLTVLSGPGPAVAQMPYYPAPYAPAPVVRPPIFGQVTSLQRGNLSGVTISLVHPAAGRSAPAVSGQNGFYTFNNVPSQGTPYYVEAYWGNQLIFRQPLMYTGGSVQFNIQVP